MKNKIAVILLFIPALIQAILCASARAIKETFKWADIIFYEKYS